MKSATSLPAVEPSGTNPVPPRIGANPASPRRGANATSPPSVPFLGHASSVSKRAAALSAASAPDRVALPELSVGVDLLARLEGICADRGLEKMADRLSDLVAFIGHDLEDFEGELARLPRDQRLVSRGASHLLALGGKRLRPMCVTLAARMGAGRDQGTGSGEEVRDLAVAVELVHSATLLHDDVVDMSDFRRGAPATRAVYGNAASIFAGDWLLIEALRRVHRCRLAGVLEELFSIIEEMILAESLQLENRGRISTDRDLYFRVVEGKTASVFRWAMSAGGRVAGLTEAERLKLVEYGRHLGIAFQATDDLLDLTGDASRTGKDLFADLREGKMTYPLIVALERDPALRPVIEDIVAPEGGKRNSVAPEGGERSEVSDPAVQRVLSSLRRTRAVEDCLELARRHSGHALAALAALPESRARRALATVAATVVDRDL